MVVGNIHGFLMLLYTWSNQCYNKIENAICYNKIGMIQKRLACPLERVTKHIIAVTPFKTYHTPFSVDFFIGYWRGWARTQTPTTRNCTVELPTFAVIAGVSPIKVQWRSLALKDTPLWSDMLSRQVSMLIAASDDDSVRISFRNAWQYWVKK